LAALREILMQGRAKSQSTPNKKTE